MKIYDISMPLCPEMPCWPAKTPITLKATRSLSQGDYCTSNILNMDIHLGTHLDAPAHFVRDGMTVDRVPLSTLVGPCQVVEFSGPPGSEIPAEVMAGSRPERILFKTSNSNLLSRRHFDQQFVTLSEGLAHSLVGCGTRLVGIDYFSADRFGSPNQPIHQILLGADVLILESLDLREVEPGAYELIALPLRIVGAEGSPVRAVLVS